jgi:two-component system sensor histidine kinase ResE
MGAAGTNQPPGTQIISDTPCGEDYLRDISLLPGGIGLLCVRVPLSEVVSDPVHQVHRQLAFAGAIAVLLALLAALVLSRRVAKPLRLTTALAQQMAAGDFSQRLGIRGSDEVGALARSFDSLADSLEDTLTDLHQEQGRLSSILNSVAEGIMAVDAAGRVVMINPQAAALLGLTQGVGATVRDLDLPEKAGAGFSACLERNETCALELELSRPERSLVMQITPVQATETGQWGAVAVVREVTEARRLEQMRRRFLSDASHEIRTPLTSIGGFASAIMDGTAATEEERVRCASVIAREVDRLSRLVKDLLDLSRIESGAEQLVREEVDLAELLHAAVESFEAVTHESGMSLELRAPEDLPPVLADADRIYQVVINLISNALRFNRPKGAVHVSAEHREGVVRVWVQDEGRGIPAAELPYIWERFYRADAARARNDGGTGLGLAIVRSIIERHGGTVSVESEWGEGSVFGFALPVK